MNSRCVATTIIDKCLSKQIPLKILLEEAKSHGRITDPIIPAICFGVFRHYFSLNHILTQLLQTPLKKKQHLVKTLLLVGLFQLKYSRIPDHAAIYETVAAAKKLKQNFAIKLLNAILRNYQRNKNSIDASISNNVEAKLEHPKWYIHELQQNYPDTFTDILNANNQQPPISLRVNTTKISPSELSNILQQKYNIKLDSLSLPYSFIATASCDLTTLDEFAKGYFSLQDLSAQFAAHILKPQPAEKILDACAAPGGKACHLKELESNIILTTIEKSASRAKKISSNAARLQLDFHQVCADILNVATWWDNNKFDKILIDAPCSATGVQKRNPDIKLLRAHSDIIANTKLQLDILTTLWPLLNPGGQLLYATCSIFPQENVEIIKKFLKISSDAKVIALKLPCGTPCDIGWQLLPTSSHDGFYYALLQKMN